MTKRFVRKKRLAGEEAVAGAGESLSGLSRIFCFYHSGGNVSPQFPLLDEVLVII